MAASKRRRVRNGEINQNGESDSSEFDDSDYEDQVVQVDFEARAPSDSDFQGIKRLLHQLFLKSHINVSQLADLIIQQSYVSSVIKQDAEHMEHMNIENEDVTFGVFSVVNMTEKSGLECVQQLKEYLIEQCSKACQKETFDAISNILMSKMEHVGLIISERFMNIPPQIALPLYETLNDDIEKAISKKKAFKFDYFMIIAKIQVRNVPDESPTQYYVNGEEEIINEDALYDFDFSVAHEQDSGLSGSWKDSDAEYTPLRKVMILPVEKWPSLLNKLVEELSQP